MLWVCVRECYWREKLYAKGETVEILGIKDWTYSGGFWHPKPNDGETIQVRYEEAGNTLLPRHFEPQVKRMVDIKDLVSARVGESIPPRYVILGAEVKEKTKEQIEAEVEREMEAERLAEQDAEMRKHEAKIEAEHRRGPGRPPTKAMQ